MTWTAFAILAMFFEKGTKFWTAAAELRERGGDRAYKNTGWPKILRTPSNCWRERGARVVFEWSILKILRNFRISRSRSNVEEKEEEELSLSGHTPDPQHSSKSFNFRYRPKETNILYKPCPQMYGFLWFQHKTLLPDMQIFATSKGTCHLRFSGIRPLRGYPPPS